MRAPTHLPVSLLSLLCAAVLVAPAAGDSIEADRRQRDRRRDAASRRTEQPVELSDLAARVAAQQVATDAARSSAGSARRAVLEAEGRVRRVDATIARLRRLVIERTVTGSGQPGGRNLLHVLTVAGERNGTSRTELEEDLARSAAHPATDERELVADARLAELEQAKGGRARLQTDLNRRVAEYEAEAQAVAAQEATLRTLLDRRDAAMAAAAGSGRSPGDSAPPDAPSGLGGGSPGPAPPTGPERPAGASGPEVGAGGAGRRSRSAGESGEPGPERPAEASGPEVGAEGVSGEPATPEKVPPVAAAAPADVRRLDHEGADGAPEAMPTAGLAWPIAGPVSSRFGYRWGRLHAGIDISVPEGTPIRAAQAGTVTFSGVNGGFGNVVTIDHGGGLSTLYAHQSALSVVTGSLVSQGQVIGFVGSTGTSTGPHLHFETRVAGTPQDPVGLLL